jgi:hypothetical protein
LNEAVLFRVAARLEAMGVVGSPPDSS